MKAMPRIASVNQDPGISPARSKGAAVHLVAMREAFQAMGAAVEAFDEPDGEALGRAISAAHRARPFGLVYERYALGKSAGARFAAAHHVPLVLEVNAPLAEERKMFRGTAETAAERDQDHYLFDQAVLVVAVSSAVADYAVTRGAAPDAVMTCPNGIDTRRFNTRVDAGAAREQVPSGAFVLGFHGRLRPWHGFELLVRVTGRLLDRGVPAHLLVVGEGEFDALDRLPAGSHTRVGWRPHEEIPGYVRAFNALPLTYQPGTPCYFSPLKLMEAMACGVVPVVPDLGDLPGVVEHGNNGFVYAAGDAARLEDLLARLAENPVLRGDLGRRAAHTAEAHSWTGIAAAILERIDGAYGGARERRQA